MSRRSYLVVYLLLTITFVVFKFLTDPMLVTDPSRQTWLIVVLVYLAVALLALSTSVRRLHDLGQSGKMIFLFLIPVVNVLLQGHLFFGNSERGPNRYGEEPL